MATKTIVDFQAELNEAYLKAKQLQPAHDEWLVVSNRIVWLERKCQGLNEAKERYQMGQTSKAEAKKPNEKQLENKAIARFKALSPEQQAKLAKLMA